MPRVRFQPLIISKRRWRGPWFPSYDTTNRDDDYEHLTNDPEKQEYSEWEDASHASSSANSSRVSSASYDSQEGLLDRRKRPKKPASAYAPRRNCNFYFTVIVGTVLVVFVLILFTLHKRSAAEVSSGIHKTEPKSPPWHDFPKLEGYWTGLRKLVDKDKWRPEYPGSGEEAKAEAIEALNEEYGKLDEDGVMLVKRLDYIETRDDGDISRPVECFVDIKKEIRVPRLRDYDGVPQGFSEQVIGMRNLQGRNTTQCLDRYRRFGPYGFGYAVSHGGIGAGIGEPSNGHQDPRIDYSSVNWHEAQTACAVSNKHRFRSSDNLNSAKDSASLSNRTAILVKTNTDHHFNAEEILQLRALISEAALATGALFSVHFLIQVMDDSPQIWSDKDEYEDVVNQTLPTEFHGMGALWSVEHMRMVYSGIAESSDSIYNADRGSFLSVQHFARGHVEYEHYWIWDLESRYSGHIGELLTQVDEWATSQPRKELWERNARFYVPTEHGSWSEFSSMVHVLAEHGPLDPFKDVSSDVSTSTKSVLGPRPHDDTSDPSLSIEVPSDKHDWGISEPADLISLSPIFDPSHVSYYTPAGDVMGYNTTVSLPPRRATTSQILRFSRRLLMTMNAETTQRARHMAPQLWPASVALQFGLKAVYAPLATYVDRKWPTDYFAAVMNTGADGGVVSGRSSVFGESQRAVFNGLSWGGTTGEKNFGRALWRRWLGYRDEQSGEGGEEWEEAGDGRMCLPPMLLGGVGSIDLVVEQDE